MGRPYTRTMNSVLSAITENPNINRKGILDLTKHSDNCVDRCLRYLFDEGFIEKVFIRMSGPHKVHNYLTTNK